MAEPMTTYDATMICEGAQVAPGDTPEEVHAATVEAWQHLIDTKLAWRLQGWFGRQAAALIETGICTAPDKTWTPYLH